MDIVFVHRYILKPAIAPAFLDETLSCPAILSFHNPAKRYGI
jgi:hypothetical protein